MLADTSVWVHFLREGARGRAADLDRLLAERSVLVCGPVLAELLAGTDPRDRHELRLTLGSLAWAGIGQSGWLEAGVISRALRERGRLVPLTDVAIAVATMRAGAALWTFDEDFGRVQEVAPGLRFYGRGDPG